MELFVSLSTISILNNILMNSLGQGPPPGMVHAHGIPPGADTDISNDSSPPHGYPDFPPSPDSWLGEGSTSHY